MIQLQFVMRHGKKISVLIIQFLIKNHILLENVAKMFKSKIIYLKKRQGERYASALTKISLNNKVFRRFGKINLKDYISSFIKR